MKQRNRTIKIVLIILLFMLSQTFIWKVISNFIPETFESYKLYPAFQVMFAWCYFWVSICLTHDNEYFGELVNKHPKIYKFIDTLADISVVIVEYVIRLYIIIPLFISFSENDINEIQVQQKEISEDVYKYREVSIQERIIFPIIVITILSIILFQCGTPTLFYYYSQIMNLMVAVVGLLLTLCNV